MTIIAFTAVIGITITACLSSHAISLSLVESRPDRVVFDALDLETPGTVSLPFSTLGAVDFEPFEIAPGTHWYSVVAVGYSFADEFLIEPPYLREDVLEFDGDSVSTQSRGLRFTYSIHGVPDEGGVHLPALAGIFLLGMWRRKAVR